MAWLVYRRFVYDSIPTLAGTQIGMRGGGTVGLDWLPCNRGLRRELFPVLLEAAARAFGPGQTPVSQ